MRHVAVDRCLCGFHMYQCISFHVYLLIPKVWACMQISVINILSDYSKVLCWVFYIFILTSSICSEREVEFSGYKPTVQITEFK